MAEMTEPKRWPNNAMALRDACADEAFKCLKDLDQLSGGVTPDCARILILRVRERQHQIRLMMALAGAPILVETPRGTIEIQAGLGPVAEEEGGAKPGR